MRIVIDGPFTADEALAILQGVRDVEQTRPEMELEIAVDAKELPVEQVEGILNRIHPPYRFRITVDRPQPFGSN